MAGPKDVPKRTYNLLVFGIERVGLNAPAVPIKRANYTLTFDSYTSSRRFNEFDGIILFQGIFEKVEYGRDWAGSSYAVMNCDKEQLDKRQKELTLLVKEGGIACFLLCKDFVDHTKFGHDARSSDLAKQVTNIHNLYRKNFDTRIPSVDAKRNEFIRFLSLYGAASSYFEDYTTGMDSRALASVSGRVVGFSLLDKIFFVPSLIPENRSQNIEEYFDLLADALTATVNKLAVDLPDWIDTFKFSAEQVAAQRKETLEAEIADLEKNIAVFRRFKRVLVAGDDPLVAAVADVLRNGFGLSVDDTDEHREDLKILDEDGKPVVFVEVKGVNTGAKLEHVNQADSHRERAGLPTTFPTVLVLNTHIKNARDLNEKDKPIGNDQIERAAKSNVLILRTLDLLALLELVKNGKITPTQAMALLTRGAGWLQAWGLESPVLLQG